MNTWHELMTQPTGVWQELQITFWFVLIFIAAMALGWAANTFWKTFIRSKGDDSDTRK